MDISFSSLRCKDVINVCDGKNLGNITDIIIDTCCGRILGIIVPNNKSFFSFFKSICLFNRLILSIYNFGWHNYAK